jgi:hypothetical protein
MVTRFRFACPILVRSWAGDMGFDPLFNHLVEKVSMRADLSTIWLKTPIARAKILLMKRSRRTANYQLLTANR